jgi:hypothetical protein
VALCQDRRKGALLSSFHFQFSRCSEGRKLKKMIVVMQISENACTAKQWLHARKIWVGLEAQWRIR